jgi:hypothetical protein
MEAGEQFKRSAVGLWLWRLDRPFFCDHPRHAGLRFGVAERVVEVSWPVGFGIDDGINGRPTDYTAAQTAQQIAERFHVTRPSAFAVEVMGETHAVSARPMRIKTARTA